MTDLKPGPINSLTDVASIWVGCADRRTNSQLSGTTVVLDPRNLVERITRSRCPVGVPGW